MTVPVRASAAAAPNSSVGERRVYQRPPVVEALIDIHVDPAPSLQTGKLADFAAGLEAQFPTRSAIMSGSLRFDAGVGAVVESSQALIGYRFSDEPTTRVMLVRRDGFTFSRHAPYDRWENWEREARDMWERYTSLFKPIGVRRLAVRYINRIDIRPSEGDRLRDFVRIYPEVPEQLPTRTAGFVMRLELIPLELPDTSLVINVGRVDAPRPGLTSILLDLDLFRRTESTAPNSPSVWSTLERLHDLENSYFESCITDRAREIFE